MDRRAGNHGLHEGLLRASVCDFGENRAFVGSFVLDATGKFGPEEDKEDKDERRKRRK